MKPNSKIIEKEVFEATVLILLLIAFLIAGVGVCSSFAQSSTSKFYKGFEGNFGARAFKIESSIPEINGLSTTMEGGNVGIVFGSEIVQAKFRALGFYYASPNVSRTIDLFEIEGLVNFYPLQLTSLSAFEMPVSPYIISGFAQDNLKFFGHYLQTSDAKINYSDVNEPYLGKVMFSSATVGVGVEWKLKKETFVERSFIHLYAEAKYGFPFSTRTNASAFEGTSIRNNLSMNVGVTFGAYK